MYNNPRGRQIHHPASRSGPVFIMGCPRSGTTLVSQILNSHPDFAIYHESYFYHILSDEMKYYGDLSQHRNLRYFVSDVVEIIRRKATDEYNFRVDLDSVIEMTGDHSLSGVLASVLTLYAQQQNKTRGGDKTPENYEHLNKISRELPDSPVLFLVRDPRDVCLSSRKLFNASLQRTSRLWNESIRCYAAHKDSIKLICYEALVNNPEAEIKDICQYIGISYTPDMLVHSKSIQSEFLKGKKDLGLLKSSISSRSVGGFHSMKPEDIQLIEALCQEGMELMGYTATQNKGQVIIESAGTRPGRLRLILEKLRYYGLNLDRWKHGWVKWRVMLRTRLRYYFGNLR
ncbi:MAG: sulfotransferase [Gammaproteobacteria bacterium]|nr:sulfotransferase [Gammaproteobacteria bacterium]